MTGRPAVRRRLPRAPGAGVLFVGAFLLARLGPSADAEPAPPQSRPNLVVILADDLGWADVGWHGSEIRTPNLDRLSSGGVRLERHYVCPTCTPTRIGLFTGRYPSRFGILAPAYGKILPDDTPTLATELRRAGYSTHLSGKWHMGSPPDGVPRRHGFDTSYGYFDGQVDPWTHVYKDGRPSWHRDDRLLDEEGHTTDLIAREAIRVVESAHGRPFFLLVCFSVPHHPLSEPVEWTAAYEGAFDEPSRRWYAASVAHMDAAIGRIAAAIERSGLERRTLLLFSSDNGGQRSWHSDAEYGGRYAALPHRTLGDNRPWRGWKGETREGGIRVPAFVRWPGALEPGEVDAPIHIVDWLPTFLGLAGVEPDPGWRLDGRDARPLLSRAAAADPSRALYWRTPEARAAMRADWKLTVHEARGGGAESGVVELYDLAADPRESRDLSKDQPEKASALRRVLEELSAADRERG